MSPRDTLFKGRLPGYITLFDKNRNLGNLTCQVVFGTIIVSPVCVQRDYTPFQMHSTTITNKIDSDHDQIHLGKSVFNGIFRKLTSNFQLFLVQIDTKAIWVAENHQKHAQTTYLDE